MKNSSNFSVLKFAYCILVIPQKIIQKETQRTILNSNKEKQPKLHFFLFKGKYKDVWVGGTKSHKFLINEVELTNHQRTSRNHSKVAHSETAGSSEHSGGECIPLSS